MRLLNEKDWTNRLELYNEFGKFDNVVTIMFSKDSDSFKLYGRLITGVFYYTANERQQLKNRDLAGFNSDIHQKFNIILKNDMENNTIEKARLEGILLKDIVNVTPSPNRNKENIFEDQEQRSFDSPEIKIEINSNADWFLVELGIYKQKIKDGITLDQLESQ